MKLSSGHVQATPRSTAYFELPSVAIQSPHLGNALSPTTTHKTLKMSDRDLQDILRKLKSSRDYADIPSLLSKAKITLLKLKALTPTPSTPSSTLLLAREVFETGALLSIRAKDPAAFTRYVHQLTPFYELPSSRLPPTGSEKNKITGLYLLLLLTQGDYAGFHTELEGLELREGRESDVEKDRYLGYPIKLERWLMEGSYDLVWKAMASREVPSEEYGVFSEVRCPHLIISLLSCFQARAKS
jgi:26S proteasome regulatory subunit N12